MIIKLYLFLVLCSESCVSKTLCHRVYFICQLGGLDFEVGLKYLQQISTVECDSEFIKFNFTTFLEGPSLIMIGFIFISNDSILILCWSSNSFLKAVQFWNIFYFSHKLRYKICCLTVSRESVVLSSSASLRSQALCPWKFQNIY